MYKFLLLPALLFLTFTLRAQNKTVIKGKVIDSLNNTPIEFATVAVLDNRDTTTNLLSYTITDKNGAFNLHNIPKEIPVKIFISFVAYQPYRKIVTLDKTETLDLGIIHLNPKELQQVTITGERIPIVIRKDTIEFNAEAFKVRPNAVVQDLLKKLPGIEVANDGNITVMGKDVTKILVDGKEFFGSDLRIASKNLDADMIARVQVYDDRENDPDHLLPDSKVNKIINLKFKRALKKSIFGKVYGGLGTQDHYQTGGLFNMFRDTLQVSVLGSSNDLNNTGFDYNDLYSSGGLNRGGEAFSRGGIAFGGGGNGKQTATNGGININTDYGKKLKVNLAYLYKNNRSQYNTLTNRQQFLNDTTAVTGSASNRANTNSAHSISGTVVWKPNDKTQIRYAPYVNIYTDGGTTANSSNSYSNFINPISNSVNSGSSSGNYFQFQQSFNYNHQLKKKGASVNIDHSITINPGNSTNFENTDYVSYITNFPSYSFRQRGDNDMKNTAVNLSGSFRYPVSKIIAADINAGASYNNELNKVSTYDYNPVTGQYDSFLLVKSSDLNRNKWTQTITPGITLNLPKNINLVAHLTTQFQQVNNIFNRNVADIDQQYFFLLPSVNLNIKGFSTGYNRSAQLPNIGDMIPYSVVYSPSYSVTGNPNLKPTTRNNFDIGYSKYNFQKGISYNLRGSASFEQSSIFRQRTLDAQLAETSTPINRDGRYNFNISSYINKQFKKQSDLHFSAATSFNLSKGHDFFVLNYRDGYQNSYRGSISERFSLNYKDIVELDPQYSLSRVYTTYTGVDYNSQNYITHSADAHFNIFLPVKMNVEGNYTYNYNPLVPTGFQKSSNLLSLSMAHQFLKKDRGEIKLSCYDILNQNINTYRYINENSITDTQSQIIKRYFMLTLQFKFNKSTVKGS
ncbi:outer membrane beta-barrel protein [Mucilaginibacter sp.]|jgi:hypothetical protein|uniref:outer membrane beta-barrel protein n=1 Tax=Mucilaginibacter sp. TaxID=1882438 RepID=UPI0035644DBE